MEIDSEVLTKDEAAEGSTAISSPPHQTLREKMLNHLATQENISFKSQQLGEPDLNFEEKRRIAETILEQSHAIFLSRFGNNLLVEHLAFFNAPSSEESYAVNYYVNKLKSSECKLVSDVQIKNRRFEAMKRLMSEGEYFSVNEMRKRNPLLFDQLLGNFLADPEFKCTVDADGHTVAHLLLEQIEQDQVAALKQAQIEAEEEQARNYVTSSDEDSIEEPMKNKCIPRASTSEKKENTFLWGKAYTSNHTIGKSRWKSKHSMPKQLKKKCTLSEEEKILLIREFTSSMFSSFLQGKDEYNYSEIDNNPEYDDNIQLDVDEEEKYFDSESPEEKVIKAEENDDDELDMFMKNIEDEITSENLADSLKQMKAEN